ncbi:MAG: YhjD/YihY/BrkB family envelope integrity protein [Thermoleophilaceae bacterium]
MAGFDRAVALAASGLTALIPLAVVTGAILTRVGGEDVADRIIDRYELTGGGAEAVRDAFSPPGDTSTSVGLLGVLLLLVAVLSFARAVQRLFEQTWELDPLSVRNTLNGLRWAGALVAYVLASGLIHAAVGRGRLELVASLLVLPLTAVFLIWGGWILTAKRMGWRNLVPFGVIASILTAAYSVGATVYVPHLFSSYATRYGVIGAVFAMISTLFCIMLVLVGSAALGREVGDELDRIRRGERPPDHEVREQWDKVLDEVRTRWRSARERIPGRPHG